MLIELQFDFLQLVLKTLLQDKNTGKNIIWATDDYKKYGPEYFSDSEMTSYNVNALDINVLQPRVTKSKEAQKGRTKGKAEVFTPSWICENMNTYCDLDWFDIRKKDKNGKVKFIFNDKKNLKGYIDLKKLEITCGEAPFVISRYDTTTGNIIPLYKRIGFLVRKLMAISQYIEDKEEWLKLIYRSYENSYGYEYQGDNLLKARINLFYSFIDYYEKKWNMFPSNIELKKIASIISRNFWQMDGLTYTAPLSDIKCKVYNWRSKKNMNLVGEDNMKFDYVIGNPPYQDKTIGENESYAPPIYHTFMDNASEVSDKVILITPARFLFNAGSTPKDWNKKMLNDKHFKVLKYYVDSKQIFGKDVDIKGGVSIHYKDKTKDFGAIEHFVTFEELRGIMQKVVSGNIPFISLDTIIYAAESCKFLDKMHQDNPKIESMLSKGHKYDFKSNVLEKLDNIVFFEDKPLDSEDREYVKILGLVKGKRIYKWILREYVKEPENFNKYKVILPNANGSGALGEVLSTPLIGTPLIGTTQTFMTIGCFEEKKEADNLLKYVKTKFARTLLGILKVTQMNPKSVWKYVPIQDFTEKSDIDWSVSVSEIDKQLYKKYGLDEKEIAFIEEKVKEME